MLLTSVPFAVGAQEDEGDEESFPINLEIVSPIPPPGESDNSKNKLHTIEQDSGWPLTFKMSGPGYEQLGVAGAFGADRPRWPELGYTGFMLLHDTNGCPDLGEMYVDGTVCSEDPLDPDVWLEFTSDEDFPEVPDESGHFPQYGIAGVEDMRLTQNSPFSPPFFNFGPNVGDDMDGIGWVRNDDLPQLVLLSNVGIGLSLTLPVFGVLPDGGGDRIAVPACPGPGPSACIENASSWVPKSPLQARNLAGFMTQVGYELNDQNRETTITTSMLVPRHLFWPNIIFDTFTSYSSLIPGCGTNVATRRVDGGPLECADTAHPFNLGGDGRFEIRAFLLQEYAPETWDDCNGDGTPGADDAECNGYTLLSNEVVLRIELLRQDALANYCQYGQDPWGTSKFPFGNGSQALVSFDGSPFSIGVDCPLGGGGTSTPPRD